MVFHDSMHSDKVIYIVSLVVITSVFLSIASRSLKVVHQALTRATSIFAEFIGLGFKLNIGS